MTFCSVALFDKLHTFEDKCMRMHGLYLFWTSLYISSLSCLLVDDTKDSSRDFLFILSSVSNIFPVFAGLNLVYGNNIPSTMFNCVGPLFQYFFWQLLAYYQADVYGPHPIGILNAVFTCMTTLFTVDMLAKTWAMTLNPKTFKEYLSTIDSKPSEEIPDIHSPKTHVISEIDTLSS